MLLDGKTAVVTGSSRGIGEGIVVGLAKEGASVVVNGTVADDVARVVKGIKAAGGKAVACVESVATMDGAQHIIQTALDSFGHLDILVNNAGILRDRTFLRMSEEEWDAVIAVHLKGHFACSKFAALHMSQRQSGRIINISSLAAWSPNIGQSNYSTAKSAIQGFTFGLAAELSRYNITVNAIAPRALTRMTGPLLQGILDRAKEEALKTNSPPPTALELGYGGPEMMAPLVCYLASDEAKDINGKLFRARGETIDILSRNEEIDSVTMVGGWTVDDVRKRVRILLGRAINIS